MTPTVSQITLEPETLLAFEAYVGEAETAMDDTARGGRCILWSDAKPDRTQRVAKGEILAELWKGKEPVAVPHGLIHDWVGAASVPGVNIDRILALIQDYDNHKNIYKPEVIDSKLLNRHGDDFKIYLRLLKKKVITVVLDTDHDVHYSRLNSSCGFCRSHSTRIAEVEDAGKPQEKVLPADTGYGFLWRLYSYWTFQQRGDATVIECRAISLTRDIPTALKWIIQPIVRKLPKESLVNTLAATRKAAVTDFGSTP